MHLRAGRRLERARRVPAATACIGLLVSLLTTAAMADPSLPVAKAWTGVYQCAQGMTGLRLTLVLGMGGKTQGLFEFYGITQNPNVPHGCFDVAGSIDQAGHVALAPGAWRLHPAGYVTVALSGQELATGQLVGQVIGPGCAAFALQPVPAAQLSSLPSACLGAIS